MKRTLQQRKGEPTHEWITRLSKALAMTPEQEEAMREVAKESYITGTHDAHEIARRYGVR